MPDIPSTELNYAGAVPDFRTWRDQLTDWQARLAATDWTPWLIIALAAFLRFLLLGMKPPHFDEGINGWFVDQMVKTGFYRYDPTNYHGPLHFYILFLSQNLFGRNLWALRLPVVLASIACIWLTMKFEPLVGRNVSRLAALTMAVSPAFVFYGRYSIHEVWMVLFSMLFILGVLGLWRMGTVNYLWSAGMGLTGMILTKETYLIHVGCAAVAVGAFYLSNLLSPVPHARPVRQSWDVFDLAMVIATGIAAIIFFYSGTFLNWNGLKGLYEAYAAWFATGKEGHGHEKPWFYWLKLIARYEWPILVSLVFCLFWPRLKNISLRYLAIYGVGTLIAYSIVRYKTPWCIISVVWPFVFVFAAAILIFPSIYRRAVYLFCAIALSGSFAHMIWLNYFRCSTDTEPYVYVQSYNDVFKLTRPVLELARRNPALYFMTGHLIRTSSYPLPWILGDFPNIGYYEHNNLPGKLDADFLLVQEDKIKEVEAKLEKSYYTEPLTIRPYQDTSKVYFEASRFKGFFRDRPPNFIGKSSHTTDTKATNDGGSSPNF